MIFLFRFDVTDKGMDFILNEEIAKDMYPDLEEMLRDLVKSLCSILEYYKVYNKEKTIFSGVIHDNGEAEVTLSKGLGKYIDLYTKNQIIFDHGKLITELCTTTMDRRSAEAQLKGLIKL
ncbi:MULTISPECIES: hypothetical protein [Bacillus cereus group]|uniref:Uncharacterized protein n=1 Tax=Bacillus cereus TaxID=1396 RepID=A0A9X7GNP5_BACCE|nr:MULTISPECIES: hypothetical protein [Bacillus cereus group]MCQ6304789.1 hypothetical protein [Bacillus cereus]PGO70331.1 hypothetical protein CN980_21135 [Bacillus cereus]PRS99040.1 hypothetical protein C6352_30575 [Bacillus thuringiensis]HEQ3527480.1 hypothetical protein [Bacillus cereus]